MWEIRAEYRGIVVLAWCLRRTFVRFLIEEWGPDAFRVVYDTEDYERAYRKSLTGLDREWRQVVVISQRVG